MILKMLKKYNPPQKITFFMVFDFVGIFLKKKVFFKLKKNAVKN